MLKNTYSVGVECFLKWTIEAFELDFHKFDYNVNTFEIAIIILW